MKDASLSKAVQKWKDGNPVWTIELGGIGPGYEQCIQILLWETVSRWVSERKGKLEESQAKEFPAEYTEFFDKVVSDLDKELGFSGSQVGMAKLTAYQFLVYGYDNMMEKVEKDRKIQVSRNFPVWEGTA